MRNQEPHLVCPKWFQVVQARLQHSGITKVLLNYFPSISGNCQLRLLDSAHTAPNLVHLPFTLGIEHEAAALPGCTDMGYRIVSERESFILIRGAAKGKMGLCTPK